MNIEKVLNNDRMLRAVLGINRKEFEALLLTFTQILLEEKKKTERKRRIGGGSNGNIKDPKKKLFYILWYVKVYPTFDVAAYVFASSKTRTHVWTHTLLPFLEKTLKREVVLPERQLKSVEDFHLLFPDVQEVMIDGVERPTIRSKKNKVQKKHYSGKKKRHMRKNVIVADKKKRILVCTPSKAGTYHDKKMSDKAIIVSRIPEDVGILGDTGFIGIQKQHNNVLLPKKRSKHNPLTLLDREMNRMISGVRVAVEHAIGGMKRYGAVSDIYRNKNGFDDILTRTCAGLWNYHLKAKDGLI